MKSKYLKMVSGLYIAYLLIGMINIILSSNMSYLTRQLNTDEAGISYLVSAIGIGKLISFSLAGKLSDKLGRKPLVVTAAFLYLIFLIGMPFAPNYTAAFVLAIIAGICNSLLDSGAYPALIEAFPKSAGTASVLVKAFVSIGATILPFMIAFFIGHNMFYGLSFFVPAVIYFITGFILLTAVFPRANGGMSGKLEKDSLSDRFLAEPKFWREGLAVILTGFTSTALFVVVQVWLPTFGREVLNLPEISAIQLLSYYSIGALVSVVILAVLLNRGVKHIIMMIVYPSVSLLSLLALISIKQPVISIISSFLVGLSTSGVLQLAITVMAEFFPKGKGTSTAYVSIASSLAFTLIPLTTGVLSKNAGVTSAFVLDLGIAVTSIILALFIASRYKKVINTK